MEIALVQKFFVYFLSTETCKVEGLYRNRLRSATYCSQDAGHEAHILVSANYSAVFSRLRPCAVARRLDIEFGGMPSITYLMWGPGIRVLSSQRNRSRLRRSRKSRFRNRRNRRYRLWDRRSRICRLLIQNLVDGPIRCLDLAGQAGPSSFSRSARENARAFSGHR